MSTLLRFSLALAVTLAASGCGLISKGLPCDDPAGCVDQIETGSLDLPAASGTWRPMPSLTVPGETGYYSDTADLRVVGPREAWVTGSRRSPQGDPEGGGDRTFRWDGQGWSVTDASLPKPPKTDWRAEAGLEQRRNGRWSQVALPPLPLPDQPKSHEALVTVRAVVALSPSDVWAVGSITSWVCCEIWSHHSMVAFHWDGKAWQNVAPRGEGTALTSVASDGHGGIWAGTNRPYVLRYSQGTWTKAKLELPDWNDSEDDPRWGVKELVAVPGSDSVMALMEPDNEAPERFFQLVSP
jgi:hypothetical protein